MDFNGIAPPCMNWADSNLPAQWKKFRRHVELMFDGPLKRKSEAEKAAYLLLWIGDKGRDIHATWDIEDEDRHKLNYLYSRFQAHVGPKLNPIFARYKFFNVIQNSDSVDEFITRLKLSAKYCDFPDHDAMIRDRIVFGTNCARMRSR